MKKTPLPIGMRRSKRLCLSFLVINFATKPLQPVEQGILPPAAYTLGTLVKKQFLSVAKLLLGSCEGKTENRHYFKLKKCDESCRGSIMRNNLFKSCLQSHCSDNGTRGFFLACGGNLGTNRARTVSGTQGTLYTSCPPNNLALRFHTMSSYFEIFFSSPYDRRKILVTELRTVPG